ncbi:MAG: hypothetical protein HLUCCA11_05080 [Phormidesmis priestleyi Ana]|uniref:Uncharacterized protein n=1 Tax=Phormidesmis priestleyi Ana TaxID=1666911 RepID=A0A0P8BS67_9CYAN|nr:MAG: hypothetical protein HLUCCA11_05080 [Phormidesmis priestleyi Ana]
MDIRLLRQLWSVVESFPGNRLSALDDSNLVRSLIDSLQSDPAFDPNHLPAISQYISSRMPLIREMSQQA